MNTDNNDNNDWLLFWVNFQYRFSSQFWFLWWPQHKNCKNCIHYSAVPHFGKTWSMKIKKQNGSCCCSRIISHWLIVVQKSSPSTADATLLVSSNNQWDKKLLVTPGKSTTFGATSMETTTVTIYKRSCYGFHYCILFRSSCDSCVFIYQITVLS